MSRPTPLLERRLIRRLVVIPLVVASAAVALLTAPVSIPVAAVIDLATGGRAWPRTRLVTMIIAALVIETVFIVASLLSWLLTGFGLLGSERWRWHMHRWYMGVYTHSMLWVIARLLGTRVEWRDHADLSHGPVVMIARHTSFFDALIPATVVSRRNRLLAHHVVTRGLKYAPCIDLVGHRFPNRFISRAPGQGSTELADIEAIGRVLDHRSAAIIFPEGTFRTVDRFERVVRRLRRREPHLAVRAAELEHVLPPRPSGTFALLQGAPTADLIVCTNTGLESFGSLRAIIDAPIARRSVLVETWRIRRADIPDDEQVFGEWLFEQFVAIDRWVAVQNPAESVAGQAATDPILGESSVRQYSVATEPTESGY